MIEANGIRLPEPLPGWSEEEQLEFSIALREVIHNPSPEAIKDEEEAAWKRMRKASKKLHGEGKTPMECMTCARHLAAKSIGYFGPTDRPR